MIETTSAKNMKRKMFFYVILAIIAIGGILFGTAGSWEYWNAWIFLSTTIISSCFMGSYLLQTDPDLLNRRMKFQEKEWLQKRLIGAAQIVFLIGFLLPGLDYRYAWSSIPFWIMAISYIAIIIGYALIFKTFRENSYASRIIEVMPWQKVISTGPYAHVRHPMYSGVLLIYGGTPLMLGLYIAFAILAPVTLIVIIVRLLNEEKILRQNLKGYREYCEEKKYRLIPYIW